jgi:membrane-bound lytic murein transglycosylase D
MKKVSIGTAILLLFFAAHLVNFPLPENGVEVSIAQAKDGKKKKKQSEGLDEANVNHFSHPRSGKVVSQSFVVPPELKTPVDFWKMVYSKYDRNSEIFHDTDNLKVIYSVLDFTDLYNNDALTKEDRKALFQPRMDAEEARIKEMLLTIHEKQFQPERLSKEERRIWELFKDDPSPDKFLQAAHDKRIRAQTGIRNKFIEAVRYSGAYIEEFEDIFISQALPIELTRLAIVESMYNTKAQSKVGASGIWQFMPSTGRIYGLEINRYVDERNDPIKATHAAARLLKSNYEALGTWPLGINAYNSGRGTMTNAVNATGTTDIATIITQYRGGVYGFASRNFYPSFLAALEVANHYPKYLGEIQRDQKFNYDTYYVKNSIRFGDLAVGAGVLPEILMEYNPYFQSEVINDQIKLPPGQEVRIPKGSSHQFSQAEMKTAQGLPAESGTAQAP